LKNNSWFANGKLLITGEYLVMEGAKALAVPLKLGQRLTVKNIDENQLIWEAKSPIGLWFKTILKLPTLEVLETNNQIFSNRLVLLLKNAKELSKHFLNNINGVSVETELGFNPEFGFGSSSTLVFCVSKWANVNPYLLQQKTFGGSGFDIACADAKGPITFQRIGEDIEINNVELSPKITNNLFLVYLGKKQQTSRSIKSFKKNAVFTNSDVDRITAITNEVVKAESIEDFEALLTEHEQLMSSVLQIPTIKSTCFPQYNGCVKSLGAWGGDFVLISSRNSKQEISQQMKSLGFNTVFSYSELVL